MGATQGQRAEDFKNYKLINNGTIKIDENTYYPSLDVRVRPFDIEHFCSQNLTFSWECTDYQEDHLEIQLSFDQTDCVSAGTNIGDSLEISFNDQRLF